MNQAGFPLLSMVIFLPMAGAVLATLFGRWRSAARVCTLVVAAADLALAAAAWCLYRYETSGMQFVERIDWVAPLGISYSLGLDGISLWLVLLTALVGLVAVLGSWHWAGSEGEPLAPLLLVLQTGALGVFCAVDLILFFAFWEAVLIPAYVLIGRWGGERRAQAALKFVVFTTAGSALMLVAIVALAMLHYTSTGVLTFDRLLLEELPLSWPAQLWLCLAFLLAFAVKAPIWPLHGWLPDAYVEAPYPVTILLAAVLSKMGIYGVVRLCLPLFPSAVEAARPWLWALAIAGVLYGALVALVQQDVKRLVAYSSLSHLGLIFSGALSGNTQGVEGALILSVSHGLTVTALFLVAAWVEGRRGTRRVDALGGLWKSAPFFGTVALTVILSAIGVPGLSAFPGEFAILVGIFRVSPAAAAFGALGLVLGAWYMLSLFRRAFAGQPGHPDSRALPDLRRGEAAILLPLVALLFVIGILPSLIFRPTEATVGRLIEQAQERRVVQVQEPGP